MTAADFALAGLVALGVVLITPTVRRYALGRGLVDRPGPRRSHRRLVARGGGIGLVTVLLSAALLRTLWADPAGAAWPLWAGIAALGTLGWIDDHRPLPAGPRLAIQCLVAALAMGHAYPIPSLLGLPALVMLPLTLIALVWLINLWNFMDGADGLASLQTVFSAALFAGWFQFAGHSDLAARALLVAAAAAGFLVWNRPPARIFLGDAGSLALGWAIGWLALAGHVAGALPVAVAALFVAPFVIDATWTLLWRVAVGRRWYTAHRDHAYQRRMRAGATHGRVLAGWLAVNLALVVPAAVAAWCVPEQSSWIALAVLVAMSALWWHERLDVDKDRLSQ